MTGKNLEIISQIVLWYENSFRIDCKLKMTTKRVRTKDFLTKMDIYILLVIQENK